MIDRSIERIKMAMMMMMMFVLFVVSPVFALFPPVHKANYEDRGGLGSYHCSWLTGEELMISIEAKFLTVDKMSEKTLEKNGYTAIKHAWNPPRDSTRPN